jgi:hypothetical protein
MEEHGSAESTASSQRKLKLGIVSRRSGTLFPSWTSSTLPKWAQVNPTGIGVKSLFSKESCGTTRAHASSDSAGCGTAV